MVSETLRKIASILLVFSFLTAFSNEVIAAENHDNHAEKEENFSDFIMHHIADTHDYHLADWNGHAISIPLPVILWTENGLVTFLSSEFHHDDAGKVVVERKGQKFVKYHEKIYYANADGSLSFDENHKVQNARPFSLSMTKNVVTLIVVAFLIFLLFASASKAYKNPHQAPKGIAKWVEPIVLFVRDDIAKPNLGHNTKKYLPYLLTIFFLIWFGNMLGLIPFISGTLTNDILFTGTLAVLTLLVTVFSGNKNYWTHIFATPGVPWWLYPIMVPVEIIGIFTKPFALMVRLFANITAGHIVILSLVGLIVVFKTVAVSPVSILFGLFISVLELMVAFVQAFVFTLLSALFIGQAVEEEHH